MSAPDRYRLDPAVLDVEARTPAAGARLPSGWVRAATAAARAMGEPFTPARLRAALPEPVHPAHFGAVVRHLHAARVIRPAGLALERSPDGSARPVRVWEAVPVEAEDPAEDAAAPAA
ncbi:hypothetical protein ACH0AG_04005 [Micrococcus luteus]|uniref:hypothetical protein n=1 Tax=Micrococcus luteus TaxID=1270 RepID=UPI00387A3656